MKHVFKILILASFVCIGTNAHAQHIKRTKTKDQQKEQVDKQEAHKEALQKELNQKRDQHMKNQDRQTRKRMKKTKKKSIRWAKKQNKPFYKRWFGGGN